jgi:hypothetical protein
MSKTMSKLSLLLTVVILAGICTGAQAAATGWPFPSKPASAERFENDQQIGLFNNHVGVLIRKSDSAVLGLWSSEGWSLIDGDPNMGGADRPLWTVELMPAHADKAVAVTPKSAQTKNYRFIEKDGRLILQMEFPNVKAGQYACDVLASAELDKSGGDRIGWRIDVKMHGDNASVWTVNYPELIVTAPDADPKMNRTIIPYRRGSVGLFGKGAVKGARSYPYPGPSAKFQFTAAWGETSGRGVYYAVEDGQAYTKVFLRENNPARNGLLLGVEHLPAGRGVAGTSFTMPYRVVTMPYHGDWWDAARLYRQWWTRQVWAQKGLLRDRQDLPDWLKRSAIITRPSTSSPGRTVAANEAGEKTLSAALAGKPFFGTWYGAFENIGMEAAGGLDHEGHGHVRPLKKGVAEAISELKPLGIHHIAYVQSLIYDPSVKGPALDDNPAALKAVARGRDGKPIHYHGDLLCMDRATTWWQDRIIAESMPAMQAGFEGIYLDSFGKSSPECFDPDHGHSCGGGNTSTAGQRKMAERLLEAIHKIDPQAFLSGEGPIEAYRDVLGVSLLSMNIWRDFEPISRTVWGDYGLTHGRIIRPMDNQGPQVIYSEMTRMFVDGTIIGRFFPTGGTFITEPQYAPELAYLNRLIHYTELGMEYLRFGEYLHPLKLPGDLPTVSFGESVKGSKVTTPGIMDSVTRSHADGSVAIVLANVSDNAIDLKVPVDPDWRGEDARKKAASLVRLDESGHETPLRQGRQPWTEAVKIQPHDVVFLVLK